MNDRKKNVIIQIILLILVIAWIIFIFSNSMAPAVESSKRSMSVLDKLLRFFPMLTEHLVRKAGHALEYTVLGVLASLLFLGWGERFQIRRWPFVLLTGVLTALTDETIQLFVEGRSGQVSDVWIDFGGVTAGFLLTAALLMLISHRHKKSFKKMER